MKAALFLLLLSATAASAADTGCPQFFTEGVPPIIEREQMRLHTAELCYTDFSVMHSGVTAGPFWSAQRLTADGIRDAKKIPRVDQFFAEPRLPSEHRAELGHYKGSGYDRGHMAPSADMTTERAQAESFTLANMVPQDPDLNRKLWADIESTTRGLALAYGEVFVVTGPAFSGERLKKIGGRVYVPTATFKAVFVPSQNAAAAWWADNRGKGRDFEVISISELERRTFIDVFPSVSDDVKKVAANLPKPKAGSDAAAGKRPDAHKPRKVAEPENSGWGDFALRVVVDLIGRMIK
jgi:DNA/RNA endonuclease G, NUC1